MFYNNLNKKLFNRREVDIRYIHKRKSFLWITILSLILVACGGGAAEEVAEVPPVTEAEVTSVTVAAAEVVAAAVFMTCPFHSKP